MQRTTRSGASFSPYLTELQELPTSAPLEQLMLNALNAEVEREATGEEDCEGADLSASRTHGRIPCSRLTQAPLPLQLLNSATASNPSSTTRGGVEVARNKTRSKARRSAKYKAYAAQPMPAVNYVPRSTPTLKASALQPIHTAYDSLNLPAASGRWVGKRIEPSRTTVWTLSEIKKAGGKVFAWDGRTPYSFTDSEGRSLVTLAGRPCDPSWDSVVAGATKAMVDARKRGVAQGCFTSGQTSHRRGNFIAVAAGVSHGGGRLAPGNLSHPQKTQQIIDELLNNPDIQRIAGFQSSAFAYYAPKLYSHYASNLGQLYEHEDHLDVNFSNSIFPAATFNLGPDTVTLEHTDQGNVPYGMCPLTCGGNYNPKKGGHLIIFDLGLIIEFPPGSTIFILSSVLRHGNCVIQEGESRVSIAQYSAGGLFRWVKYGFRSVSSIEKKPGGKAAKRKLDGNDALRTQEALALLPKVSTLDADRRVVFHSGA